MAKIRTDNHCGPIPTVVTEELVEEVAELLAQRKKKHEIKDYLRTTLEMEVHPRSVETLITRARHLILERAKRSKTEHLALSVEFLEKIIADDSLPTYQRMKALDQLNYMLGVGGSFKMQTESPDETARAIRQAQKEMDETATEA